MALEEIGMGFLQDIDVDENGNLLSNTFGAGNKPVLFMMQRDQCHHCKTAKPDFARLFLEHGQRKVFICTLKTDSEDPSTQKLMRRFPGILKSRGVNFYGVPTYIVWKNGKYSTYDGPRDFASLNRFINSL